MSRRPGRPRREYPIRVRAERREKPDYEKLARALLEHAAMQERARREAEATKPEPVPPSDPKKESE